MQTSSFWKAGHTPTLLAAFFYFDLSFMVWYVLGPLGVQIAAPPGGEGRILAGAAQLERLLPWQRVAAV